MLSSLYTAWMDQLLAGPIPPGDPIIYLVNDYQKELWNGSLGTIESVLNSNGRRSLLCCLDGLRQEIPEEDFHRIGLAYAITVHKAQGSQFKRVIVPMVKNRLLDRTLIYTALTRGMEQVVFIGTGTHSTPPLSRRLTRTSGRSDSRSEPASTTLSLKPVWCRPYIDF